MKIIAEKLRREFGKTVAVDSISFSFDSGQIYAFVGPNGAGKTTTMRIFGKFTLTRMIIPCILIWFFIS